MSLLIKESYIPIRTWNPLTKEKEVTEEDKDHLSEIMYKAYNKHEPAYYRGFLNYVQFIRYKYNNDRQIEVGYENDEFLADLDNDTFIRTSHSYA